MSFKNVISLILTAILLLGAVFPVFAAGNTGFSDVPTGEWYTEAVQYAVEKGLMDGAGGGRFNPSGKLSRAMMVTVLYRFAGEPEVTGDSPFADVPDGEWYSKAVIWAEQNHMVDGYGGGKFGPTDTLLREQMAAILWRFAGKPEASSAENSFSDLDDVSGYAKPAVCWAQENRVISGVGGGRFAPKGTANRAQLAMVMMNGIENQVLVRPVETPSPAPSAAPSGTVPDAVTGATEKPETSALPSELPVEPTVTPTPTPTPVPTPIPLPSSTPEHRILIAYFSRTGENYSVGVIDEGNTAKFAGEIAAQTDGTLFEIVPTVAYPEGYEATKTIATRERNNNERPAIRSAIENFEEYDTVFIGYPIWWGDLPMILHTFMESYDFTGKTVIPFNTHEGSGQSGTQRTIANKLSGAEVKQGMAMRGSDAQKLIGDGTNASVKSWLQGLGYVE